MVGFLVKKVNVDEVVGFLVKKVNVDEVVGSNHVGTTFTFFLFKMVQYYLWVYPRWFVAVQILGISGCGLVNV